MSLGPREDEHATRETARVALVTCELFPQLWDDDKPLQAALQDRGVAVDVLLWDDPDADWTVYDLTVLRSPWDYPGRLPEFLAWTKAVPRLVNPAAVVAWNTDKHYLGELAAAGLAITPTTYVEPGTAWNEPTEGEWVIKPTVSAGSRDTGRYTLPQDLAVARAHVQRLTTAGRTAMIQPYLAAIDTEGETAVLYLSNADGELTYSHSIRKGPMLTGPGERDPDKYREAITAREPSPAERDLAARVLNQIPGGTGQLLYARIDMIPGPAGEPVLLELELTEPSLFLRQHETAAARLADAIIARL